MPTYTMNRKSVIFCNRTNFLSLIGLFIICVPDVLVQPVFPLTRKENQSRKLTKGDIKADNKAEESVDIKQQSS